MLKWKICYKNSVVYLSDINFLVLLKVCWYVQFITLAEINLSDFENP